MENKKDCCQTTENKSENSVKKHKSKTFSGNSITTAIFLVITLFIIAQTVQTYSILKKINSGNFSSENSGLKSSGLEDLPDMVGGC